MPRKYSLIILTSLLLVFIVACMPIWIQSAPVNGTQTAFDRIVNQTITARFIQQKGSGGALTTAFANATQLSQTNTAQALLNAAVYPATATAIFPILEELPFYGVSPLDGNVTWIHRPITISLTGINQFGYANDYPQITAGDFVLASDITWNTKYGLSGCGFMFRSDGNKAGPNQLMVLITRSAEGMVAYVATAGGKITNYQTYYPWVKDRTFNWQNDSTNRLVVVARGKLVDIYTNRVLIAEVDTSQPPSNTVNKPVIPTLTASPSAQQLQDYQQMMQDYQSTNEQLSAQSAEAQRNYNSNNIHPLLNGFLGFAASNASGITTCKFSNAWLFLFKQTSTPTPTFTPTYNGTEGFNTTLATMAPTTAPLYTPDLIPTITFVSGPQPTPIPTSTPTPAPTATSAPTVAPTATEAPTVAPTEAPTAVPTEAPTSAPTQAPTAAPTQAPTATQPPVSTP